jgi:hypothetical protein
LGYQENILMFTSCSFVYEMKFEKDSIIFITKTAIKSFLILDNLFFKFLNGSLVRKFIYNLAEDFNLFFFVNILSPKITLNLLIDTNPTGFNLLLYNVNFIAIRTQSLVSVFQGEVWKTRKNYLGLFNSKILLSRSEYDFLTLISTTDVLIKNTEFSFELTFVKSLVKVSYSLIDLCANKTDLCFYTGNDRSRRQNFCGNNFFNIFCSKLSIINSLFIDRGSNKIPSIFGNNLLDLDEFYSFFYMESTNILLFMFNHRHFLSAKNLLEITLFKTKTIGLGSISNRKSSFMSLVLTKSDNPFILTLNLTVFSFNKMSHGCLLTVFQDFDIINEIAIHFINSTIEGNIAWINGALLSFERAKLWLIESEKSKLENQINIKLDGFRLTKNRVRNNQKGDIYLSELSQSVNIVNPIINRTNDVNPLKSDHTSLKYLSIDGSIDSPPSYNLNFSLNTDLVNRLPVDSGCIFVIRGYDEKNLTIDLKYLMSIKTLNLQEYYEYQIGEFLIKYKFK